MKRNTSLAWLGFASYDEYLRSELWAQTRRRLNKRMQCFVCGSRLNLHHHHRSYERLGEELPDDIVILCERHHSAVHDLVRQGVELLDAHLALKARWKANVVSTQRQKKTYSLPRGLSGSPWWKNRRKIAPVTVKKIDT